jgi:hypothetical protein
MIRKNQYEIIAEDHSFINPLYQYKFGIRPIKQSKIIVKIPFVRDFFTTSVNYLISIPKS